MAGAGAGLALLSIAAGAVLTSGLAATPHADTVAMAARIHAYAAAGAGAMAVLVLLSLLPTNTPNWVRALAWSAVGVLAAEAALSRFHTRDALSPALALAHAAVAPVVLAILVALAVFTMLDWSLIQPDPVDLTGSPSLALVAKLAPGLVLLQILLGVGYRHKEWGVMPHMAGAAIVAIALLVIPVLILQRFGEHASLKATATAAMSVALTQITLGIAAFLMRLLDFDTSGAFVAVAAAHVSVGALTLAASLVLAIEVSLSAKTGV